MLTKKVAVVHEWLVTFAGSESVVEQILALYPQSDLFTLVDFLPESQRPLIQHKTVTTSFIQKLPWAKKKYRSYLPFMPLAIEQFDLSAYDVVLSSSHAVAKGVLTGPNQLHICYCHSPMRYAWDLYHQYLNESGLKTGLSGAIAKLILHYIRLWDYQSAQRVDYFVANSRYIARRIRKVYGREADVIYPPVDTAHFALGQHKEAYYLTASRMVPYKKINLIVEAFSTMPDKRLVVVGDGPDYEKIKRLATPNIELVGYQSDDALASYMQKAKAFIFAAEEDFGITPVEAQACGTPVLAYGKGGVLESVVDQKTGLFFDRQTVASLKECVQRFDQTADRFDPAVIHQHAQRFSRENFRQEFDRYVNQKMADWF
ncbi:glycosyltransferase family 4 protein [Larkinella rosea]|uniref:Glycosyltransferase family 4 protein n=1 Tax=Larkinella rosea TaxID=2025312 RepID=A0A3P1BSI2_9BACT|nr:glycosyltransferase family 4 protein [Larkinella rosea]RRB04071.1 glycosyltransferase family 4 protein [Larkinella rosea]